MRISKTFFTFWILMLFFSNIQAQQQSSKSKSADKLYEKGELSNNVLLQNTSKINTTSLDFSPVFYQNGLVYVTSRHKNGPKDKKIDETFFELFYAEVDANGMPDSPEQFSIQINSQAHEGPVTFNRAGDKMYFTRNNLKRGLTKANTQGKIVMKVYEARKGQFDWEDVKEMPFNSDEYACMHPALSADGSRLYFASNMEGGFGGSDLYMVEKRADTWSEPINLGPEINTDGNDAFPFMHYSGTLFFSSTGHEGLGGYDLFMIDLNSEAFVVKNLGEPFNSSGDDLGFIINDDGTRGYFASDRDGGSGKDDIYLFEAIQTIIESGESSKNISSMIITMDEQSEERLPGASVRIFERATDGFIEGNELYDVQLVPNSEDGELVMKLVRKNANSLGEPTLKTNNNGEAVHQLKSDKNYIIIASKDGYENAEILYSTTGAKGPQTIRIPMGTRSCATLNGVVTVEEYKTPVPNALVRIINECTGEEDVMFANAQGRFEACLPMGCEYAIYAEKAGYTKGLNKISTVDSDDVQNVDLNVQLKALVDNIIKEPIKEGSVIVLENIYYDFNKSAIRTGAARELDALIALMKSYPSMEVEMVAHTDSRGTEEYNLDLSLRRAESAKKYLIRNGVEAHRIKAFGYGEAQLRNNCTNDITCDDQEHQYNRRTEVKITKIDEPVKVQYQDGDPKDRMD